MDGEESFASSREFCPQFGSILPFPEKGTVVMKCKTCPLKVNAKSKFGIYYVFLVETGACKVVCEGPWTCAVRYLLLISCDNRNPPSSRRSETGGLRHKTDIIGVTSSFDQFLPDSWSDSSFFSTFQNHDRHSKHMELIFIVWQRHLEPLKQHHENIWQKKRQKLTKRLTEYIHNP